MTTALIWILTPLLILDCLLLGLLVLIQLPKKEAGVGMAFGGGATDALFGAGSGTALTKLTKYTAGIFFVLVLAVAILNVRAKNQGASDTMTRIQKGTTQVLPPAPLSTNVVPTGTPGADLPILPSIPPSNSAAGLGAATNVPAK